jgi:hypothetical protein
MVLDKLTLIRLSDKILGTLAASILVLLPSPSPTTLSRQMSLDPRHGVHGTATAISEMSYQGYLNRVFGYVNAVFDIPMHILRRLF